MPYGMAARVGDLTSHGSPLAPGIGSTNVLIGSMPAWRALMDFHACPIVKVLIPDVGGMVMLGSPTVLINSMMACRVLDMVVEIPGGPNPIAMGATNVFIGDVGVVAPSVGAPGMPIGLVAALAAPSLAAIPHAAAAQVETLKDAAKAGIPFCEKCHHVTDGLTAADNLQKGTAEALSGGGRAGGGSQADVQSAVLDQASQKSGTQTSSTDSRDKSPATGVFLELVLHFDNEPLGGKAYTLRVGSKEFKRTTDANGVLREEIDAGATEGHLKIDDPPLEWQLDIGELNPPTDIKGAQQRLNNLDHPCGEADGNAGPRTRAAVRQFQSRHGLQVTGALDGPTKQELKKSHDDA